MKQMIYKNKIERKILYYGFYKGYEFYILSLGTYPTAYVNVENNPKLNGKDYLNIDICVHGGLTYSKNYLIAEDLKSDGWFIGWDYAHCDDYNGLFPDEFQTQKKWTTEEIYEDVKFVIEQCINYKLGIEINNIYFDDKEKAIAYINDFFREER